MQEKHRSDAEKERESINYYKIVTVLSQCFSGSDSELTFSE